MALLKEDEFKKMLSSSKFESVYLLYGEEKFLVSHYTDLLTKKVAPIINEFNFHLFDDDADISDISVAVNVMPFMSERNVVKIVDFDFNKFNKDDYDAFLKILKNIPDTTIVIITMPTLDEKQAKKKEDDEEKGKKSFAKLKDYVTKHGVCVNFEHRAELKLEKTLCKWAKDGNSKMSELTASKLINFVGTDLTSLHSEVEKLCAFANGEEITEEMIEKLVTKNLEAQIFSLFDFIVRGQSDKAMTTLSTLFFQNEAPIAIITILSNAYVDFYRAKVARESSIFPDDFAKELKYPSNRVWVLKNMLNKYGYVTTSAIRKSIEEITNVYERLVSVSTNAQTELEKLVAKLILFAKDKTDE
ncbi:MAG: DNA polymerase III subunit delta [Oscillospiraceae bacterium]|nr:DNA polymerase III subunit delta [Candidatus Ruminococcus equi]